MENTYPGCAQVFLLFLIGFLPTKTALGLQSTKAGSGKTFGTHGSKYHAIPKALGPYMFGYMRTLLFLFLPLTKHLIFGDFWEFWSGFSVRFELILFCPASLYAKKIPTAAPEKDG